MSTVALYRLYRPQIWDDVKGQEGIVSALKGQVLENRPGHAYLFSGTRGTGKTSVARLFARALNCEGRDVHDPNPCGVCKSCKELVEGTSLNVIELDAATHRRVEEARQIVEEARYGPIQGKFKIFILDEAHMLTNEAANTLLKTIEEPSERVIFILATTNPEEVLLTIRSRCQRFSFSLLSHQVIREKLVSILQKENFSLPDDVIELIVRRARGSMRDAESLLQAVREVHNPHEVIPSDALPSVISLTDDLFSENKHSVLERVISLRKGGQFTVYFLETVIEYWGNLLMQKNESRVKKLCRWLEYGFLAQRYAQCASIESVLMWLFAKVIGVESQEIQAKDMSDTSNDLPHNGMRASQTHTRGSNGAPSISKKNLAYNEDLEEEKPSQKNDEGKILLPHVQSPAWSDFCREAISHLPSLGVVLTMSVPIIKDEGIYLLCKHKLQAERLQQFTSLNVLQNVARSVYGKSILKIEVSSDIKFNDESQVLKKISLEDPELEHLFSPSTPI